MEKIETWVLYDKNRKPLNKVVGRDTETMDHEYHLSVHAWLKTSDKFLVFQRSATKKTYPNLFEPIGGGVNGYEDPTDAIIREVKEESGITISKEQITKKFSVVNSDCKFHEICDVFVFETNFNLNDVKTEEGKNKNPQLLTKQEILELINNKKFLPLASYKSEIEKF